MPQIYSYGFEKHERNLLVSEPAGPVTLNYADPDSMIQPRVKYHAQSALKHLYAIWLFTFSDLKTIIGPETMFGILSALSGPVLTKNPHPQTFEILRRTPQIVLWIWINLLPFLIDNQRQPKSILEDTANKPWRPMPSHLVSQSAALKLVLSLYPLAIMCSWYLGGFKQCLSLIVLGYWYNDLRGADGNWFIRNLINACGFTCFASGATEIASGNTPFSPTATSWFLLIGAVVLTSVHSQDMYDQAGDSARGRKTLPLVLGDRVARWTIALAVGFWSVFCPSFWGLSLGAYIACMSVGAIIMGRTLSKKTIQDDRCTFRIWNAWMVLLYCLPILTRLSTNKEIV